MSTSPIQDFKNDYLHEAYRNFRQGHILQDELKNLSFLEANCSHVATDYKFFLIKGRQGVLERLAESMLREDIMGMASTSYDLYVIGSILTLNVPAIDKNWQKTIETLHTYVESGHTYKLYPLLEGECLVIPVSGTYAFNRVEVDGDILHISYGRVKTIEHAVELLHLMRNSEIADNSKEQSAWSKLAEELVNGSANLALSYAYWDHKKKGLKQKAGEQGVSTTIDWVLLQKLEDRYFDSSLFFERLSVEGHNLHPCTKTKLNMEPEAVFRYAPEFDGVADIQFVGIRQDYAEWRVLECGDNANEFLFKEYPELPKAVEREFAGQSLNVHNYVFVPVHPWQLEKAIPEIYEKELKERIVVPVRSIKVPSGATSSFRTVVPLIKGKEPKHTIKVAVNSQMTSTVRSISPNTTNNATVFTRLIRSIMVQEKELADRFVPVCECAGFNFKIKKAEWLDNKQELKSRNLSAVLRENVESLVAFDEVAIVGSSLFSESPITDKPIFMELIERYAKETEETSLQKAVFQFVSEYITIALSGFLTLMVKYGIGLEGHLQNSVMVYKKGRPIRMLFRDWGGTRIYQGRLKQPEVLMQFSPGSVTVTDNLKEMHNKVFYTVFQNHCGELILQACKHFRMVEGELWQEVHRICDKLFHQFEILPEYSQNARIDRKAFYQADVDYKALAKMRLEPEGKEYSYATVANPLHQFSRKLTNAPCRN